MKETKYKALSYTGGHYVIGMYVGFNLAMTFTAYPVGGDFFMLYPKDFILWMPKLDKKKRRLHYSDIDFSGV